MPHEVQRSGLGSEQASSVGNEPRGVRRSACFLSWIPSCPCGEGSAYGESGWLRGRFLCDGGCAGARASGSSCQYTLSGRESIGKKSQSSVAKRPDHSSEVGKASDTWALRRAVAVATGIHRGRRTRSALRERAPAPSGQAEVGGAVPPRPPLSPLPFLPLPPRPPAPPPRRDAANDTRSSRWYSALEWAVASVTIQDGAMSTDAPGAVSTNIWRAPVASFARVSYT